MELLGEVFSPNNMTRWSGPQDARVTQNVDVSQSAYLEAGLTLDHYRRKGVAKAILAGTIAQ